MTGTHLVTVNVKKRILSENLQIEYDAQPPGKRWTMMQTRGGGGVLLGK